MCIYLNPGHEFFTSSIFMMFLAVATMRQHLYIMSKRHNPIPIPTPT